MPAARHPRTRFAARAAGLLLGLGCLGLDGGWHGGDAPLVILVSIDTLRADVLGSYGGDPAVSPHLDALAAESTRFATAIAQAPSTLASHAAMLTSLHPWEHTASFAARRALPPGPTTLAEAFSAAGWRTHAIVDGGQVDAVWGLGRGFDSYRQMGTGRFGRNVSRALGVIDRHAREPTFVFLHTYEVHHPYEPRARDLEAVSYGRPRYDGFLRRRGLRPGLLGQINRGVLLIEPADGEWIRRNYEAEVHSVDRAIGLLRRALVERRRWDRTLLVVTSDHGEELGEHGWWGWHSHTLYDELLRVPLLIRLPDGAGAGRVVSQQVRSIDIAPTLLAHAGVAAPPGWSGVSLLDTIAGRAESSPAAASQLDQLPPADEVSLRTPRYKLIGARLFDLGADPAETIDRAGELAGVATALAAERDRLLTVRPAATPGEAVTLDAEQERALRALGYLQ